MDFAKSRGKKNFIVKTLARCGSFCNLCPKSTLLSRTKSSHKTESNKVAPVGCFSVYVGPNKQRFIIKTEYANHPLFKMLLEDAELEYGYNSEGPILIPCEVDIFYRILAEIEINSSCDDDDETRVMGSCSPFGSNRRLGNRCGSYVVLTTSRSIKMN
ncbi:hypothetical protein LguiA_009727 [Lonicera macranthoides]